MPSGYTRVPLEISLFTSGQSSEINAEIDVDVLFTAESGREWRLPAFWAGGAEFRARFAPPEPGRYRWQSLCTAPADCGVHGQSGELEIEPYHGPCELYRHGPLRVAASGRTLEHADGQPFFWLGDTWWMALTPRLDWPQGFDQLVRDRVDKGFNLVQLIVGPYADYYANDAWNPQQANEGGFSWEPGWARINPAYFDAADRKIAALVEQNLVPFIVGMWGYYVLAMGRERAQRHWRHLIARYSAYPVIWCLAGEVNLPTYDHLHEPDVWQREGEDQRKEWTEIGRYVRALDPYHHPITAHPSAPDTRAMLLDETVFDVNILQTGHGSYASLQPSVEMVAASHKSQFPCKPVVNSEVCYEGIMGGSWQEVQRFLFWTSLTMGSAGHTYGAQGIWGMHSRYAEYVGVTGSWGDGYWQDAMHYPGSTQMGIGRRFFERYPWWRFTPLDDPALPAGRLNAFAAGIPGEVALYYLPINCLDPVLWGMQRESGCAVITVAPTARYQAHFFNPRSGKTVPIGAVQPDAEGRWTSPRKPGMDDWVLVLEQEDRAACSGGER